MTDLAIAQTKKLLVTEGILTNYRRRQDDSVSISVESTKEFSSEDIAHLDSFRKTTGYFVFAQDAEQLTKAIPSRDTDASRGRTRSTELRWWLKQEWEYLQPPMAEEAFYDRALYDLIEDVKARLPRGGRS